MPQITTLEEAFIHGLSDIYSAEQQLAKALPKMAKAASNEELASGFEEHLEETKAQIERIDQIVEDLEIDLESMTCEAMKGLVEEDKEVIREVKKGPIRDVMLIAGAQKVEHYEIASYGCLVEIARQLGYEEAVELLEETLEEEKATDEKLTQIAISSVNEEALEMAA
jgi:ferritin-like metal-binding protein YciE